MSVGPLRRITAAIGLLALAPIALLLLAGAITPWDAALRASVTATVILLVGNATRLVLTGLLRRVEQDRDEPSTPPGRDGTERRGVVLR